MIAKFFEKLKHVFQDETLRKRVLFVLLALAIFRVLAIIPIPNVNEAKLAEYFANNNFLGLMNLFSGGGLSGLSIVMLGVGPFITASIIMQLLTVVSPKLKKLYQEEGEAGRAKFIQYARFLTVPLAALQAFGFYMVLKKSGVVIPTDSFETFVTITVITAGAILLMWLGELTTEFGVGNGVSIIIFAGIVAGLPKTIANAYANFNPADLPTYTLLLAMGAIVTAFVVFITEAERPIPITYSKQARMGQSAGQVSTYLPIRINQAGVMPIIFAISILLFPQMLMQYLSAANVDWASSVAQKIDLIISNPFIYAPVYFVLVVVFTFFYTAITFEPKTVAENLQKSGAFIPGIRPGRETMEFLANVVTRITLAGAVFLGFIAILPTIVQSASGLSNFAIGGTALLIAVSVLLDVIKKIEAQLSVREY